jgi:hypothetical protein
LINLKTINRAGREVSSLDPVGTVFGVVVLILSIIVTRWIRKGQVHKLNECKAEWEAELGRGMSSGASAGYLDSIREKIKAIEETTRHFDVTI